jgi:hypothetical protein
MYATLYAAMPPQTPRRMFFLLSIIGWVSEINLTVQKFFGSH